MIKKMFFYILLILLSLVALKVMVVLIEPHLTFFPVRGMDVTYRDPGTPFREIPITTADGETIYAWQFEHPEARAEVLFFHGNGGNLALWQGFLASIHDHALTVFALDYRGYGKSTGSPSERGLYRDAEAFIRCFWGQVHEPGQKVLYWGRSLGGPVAAFAASVHEPDGLILEATFPTKASLLDHYPVYKFLNYFSRFRFPTIDFLKETSCPVLIIHGEQDRVVPLGQGKRLYDQLRREKFFQPIAGADHNDIELIQPQQYWRAVDRLIGSIENG